MRYWVANIFPTWPFYSCTPNTAWVFFATSDVWSSTSQFYLILTIHYIKDQKLFCACHQSTYFPQRKLIEQGLRNVLEFWELKEENIDCMTTDRGGNVVKMLELNSWKWFCIFVGLYNFLIRKMILCVTCKIVLKTNMKKIHDKIMNCDLVCKKKKNCDMIFLPYCPPRDWSCH